MEFSYVPDGSLQGISYAPNLVCPGELSIYGFEEYTGEEARKRFPRVT
jgi:hypothetical protein